MEQLQKSDEIKVMYTDRLNNSKKTRASRSSIREEIRNCMPSRNKIM